MNNPFGSIRTKLFVCAFAVVALASASHAFSQGIEVKVKVPFAFESGSQHYPADTYMISRESDHVLLFKGHSISGFVLTSSAESPQPAATGKVIFHRYGDHYYLRQVWMPGSTTGSECARSREEKQAQIAMEKTNAPNVELTLNASR